MLMPVVTDADFEPISRLETIGAVPHGHCTLDEIDRLDSLNVLPSFVVMCAFKAPG